jgi:hypothetical protein
VGYRLLADSRTYGCGTWDDLVDRLLWAREQGFVGPEAIGPTGEPAWTLDDAEEWLTRESN